jgi:hypothetical protein
MAQRTSSMTVAVALRRPRMTHELKCWPGNFEATVRGDKHHEIRVNDRDFQVGDLVILREFIPDGSCDVKTRATNGVLTNNAVVRRISYVSKGGTWGLPDNICVFSHQPTRNDGR